YIPDATGNPAPAYNSVLFIQNTVYLGWLIRGVHFWSANILIIMVLIHMARVYWTGSYRAPRELNWMVGILMLLCILGLSLTGYLLPWDNKAYFATEVTIKIAGSAPRRSSARSSARSCRADPWSARRRCSASSPSTCSS